MSKDFQIIYLTDTETAKSKAVKVLFPELKNGKWKIEVHNAKQRSLPQNAYYWKVVVKMIQDGFYEKGTEITKDSVHDFLKTRFNSIEVVNEETGEVIKVPQSTTKLMTTGFIEYIEKIQQFAAEWFGIYIPSPNEQMQIDYSVAVANYDPETSAVIINGEKN